MRKVIKLGESDLVKIVNRAMTEQMNWVSPPRADGKNPQTKPKNSDEGFGVFGGPTEEGKMLAMNKLRDVLDELLSYKVNKESLLTKIESYINSR